MFLTINGVDVNVDAQQRRPRIVLFGGDKTKIRIYHIMIGASGSLTFGVLKNRMKAKDATDFITALQWLIDKEYISASVSTHPKNGKAIVKLSITDKQP